jgi:hypothetical protein
VDVLVLMNSHEIEPIIRLHIWPKELDLAIPKGPKEPLVSHIAHPIQRQLGVSLLQQHRFDGDVVRLRGTAIIIQ